MSKHSHLLVIDPQNDFCDFPRGQLPQRTSYKPGEENELILESPALPVPGAHEDMLRLGRFIRFAAGLISGITVTLDSHAYVGIERTTFWVDAKGSEVAPFTEITAESVAAGHFNPVFGKSIDPISRMPLTARVIDLLTQLETKARRTLMVWPVHCVTATWGAGVHPAINDALADWERQSGNPVKKVFKGEYPLVEHYGIFEAEVPLMDVPSTRFNLYLADKLTSGPELLLVAGQASSHCVAASVDQLIRFNKRHDAPAENIVLLTDCMSPVAGFEHDAKDFIARTVAAGGRAMTCQEAFELLSA